MFVIDDVLVAVLSRVRVMLLLLVLLFDVVDTCELELTVRDLTVEGGVAYISLLILDSRLLLYHLVAVL